MTFSYSFRVGLNEFRIYGCGKRKLSLSSSTARILPSACTIHIVRIYLCVGTLQAYGKSNHQDIPGSMYVFALHTTEWQYVQCMYVFYYARRRGDRREETASFGIHSQKFSFGSRLSPFLSFPFVGVHPYKGYSGVFLSHFFPSSLQQVYIDSIYVYVALLPWYSCSFRRTSFILQLPDSVCFNDKTTFQNKP